MRVIDLTYPLKPSMAQRLLRVKPENVLELNGSNSFIVEINNHIGTHVECPFHNIKEGKKVSEIPPEVFVGEAVIFNLTHRVKSREITERDLEEAGSKIQPGDIALLMTNYDEIFRPEEMQSIRYQAESPYLTFEAIEWLINHEVKLVGIDFWSIEQYPIGSEGEPKHILLFKKEIPLIHSLTNLRKITSPRVFFIALPLPIEGIDSMPVRAIAIEFQ
ncbi:MAG: cyclase family protein [Candidatus Bathyarchaeia archaeon]